MNNTARMKLFASRILATSRRRDGNGVVFPQAIIDGMMMVAAGGSGAARREIEQQVGFKVSGMDSFTLLARQNLPTGVAKYKMGTNARLWADNTIRLDRTYTADCQRMFATSPSYLPFSSPTTPKTMCRLLSIPKGSRSLINERHMKSPAIVSAVGHLSADFGFVEEFSWSFAGHDKTTLNVPYRTRIGRASYAIDGDTKKLMIPSNDGKLQLVVVMPPARGMGFFLGQMNWVDDCSVIRNDRQMKISMPAMPHFMSRDMTQPLKTLGIKRCFEEDNKDFKALTNSSCFWLGGLVHYAQADLFPEKSTAPEKPEGGLINVSVDVPFCFAVINSTTRVPIVLGSVSVIYADEDPPTAG